MPKKVLVAMSGGVDSSVCALLLTQKGYSVCAATMKLFHTEDVGMEEKDNSCCSLSDVEDARRTAFRMGIDHYVFNLSQPFRNEVMQKFADCYEAGQTPNPCIDCNRYIKFPLLLQRARLLEQDFIATGHYARVQYDEATGRYQLKKARDTSKDQTYVLYAMTQDELEHTLFPLGDLLKSEVRALALENGFCNAKKPDSQDICFVRDRDYVGFITQFTQRAPEPGTLLDITGSTLATHKGHIHYTIGQRKGLPCSFGKPQYVVEKDAASNTVTVGDEQDLFCRSMVVGEVNWVSIDAPTQPLHVSVKTRYRQQETPAVLTVTGPQEVRFEFEQPQRAVTPGQAAVFYGSDLVLGGGTILSTGR